MNASITRINENDVAIILNGIASNRRQPTHLIALIDVSDSMTHANKLETVKNSLEFIVPLLNPSDLFSMITFGETSEILLNKIPASDKDSITYKIRNLRTNGCTNLSAGLMSIQQVVQTTATHKQGVLILTDGLANRGVSDSDGLKRIIASLLQTTPSLTFTTVGYGQDHNVDLLRDIATNGAGSYNIVYNLENVATTFGEVVGGLTTVVAQNVVVHLPPGSEPMTGYGVVGDQVRIGDIYAENEIIVLAKVSGAVRITGHNMVDLSSYDIVLSVPSDAVPAPKNIEKAIFRFKVSKVLKDVAKARMLTSDAKSAADSLLAQLKELPYYEEQIIQIMIDDLEELLDTPPNFAVDTSHVSQHSAYLDLGRGLRSIQPQASQQAPQDSQQAPEITYFTNIENSEFPPPPTPIGRSRTAHVDTTFSPFSNNVQRVATQNMRLRSSRVTDESS